MITNLPDEALTQRLALLRELYAWLADLPNLDRVRDKIAECEEELDRRAKSRQSPVNGLYQTPPNG